MLTEEERIRYSKQILFLGETFQEKLKKSSVAVVGLGGLGSPTTFYLAAAGVGRLKLIDGDKVSLDNLNRQILYTTKDIGKPKAEVAAERISQLNPDIEVVPIKTKVSEENSKEVLGDVDIILDCTDGWKSKLLLADVAWELKKPLVHAGIKEWYGQIYLMVPGKTPHLREVLGEPADEEPIPVIGVTPGIVGTLQALIAMKYLAGMEVEEGVLIFIDLKGLEIEKISV